MTDHLFTRDFLDDHERRVIAQARQAFLDGQGYCWLCGKRYRDRLVIHELIRGTGIRPKAVQEPATWVCVCWRCHNGSPEAIHNAFDAWEAEENVGVARQLALKQLRDPDRYDRVKVNRLSGWADEAITDNEVDAQLDWVTARTMKPARGF